MDGHVAGRKLDLLAVAGQGVGAPAVDGDGGVGRRHLVLLAEKPVQGLSGKRGVGELVWHRGRPDDLALGVVGVRGRAKLHLRDVGLAVQREHAEELGGLADTYDQHAGGRRVERAGVPDALLAHRSTDAVDHVVAGEAEGLVDGDERIQRARAAAQRTSWA